METYYIVQFKNALTGDRWEEYSRNNSLKAAKLEMQEKWHTPHRLVKMTSTVIEEKAADA